MSTTQYVWQGDAQTVRAVYTITVANTWATGDTATVTIDDITLTLTVGTDATTAQVALAIQEMLSGTTQTGTGDHTFSGDGSVIGQFAIITWTVSGSVVTGTGATDGRPIADVVVGETTAGTGTATGASATAGTGPHDWENVDNWDQGSVPTGGGPDGIHISRGAQPIKYGLANSADTLEEMHIRADAGSGFYIGLPWINEETSYSFTEHLPTELAISITDLYIGEGEGDGCGRIKINAGSNKITAHIHKTGTALDTSEPPIQIRGTHTDNVFNVFRGHLGIAIHDEQAANYDDINVGYIDSAGDATVEIGDTVTAKAAGKITQTGGTVKSRSAIYELDQTGTSSYFWLLDDAGATTVTVGGTFYDLSSGTIATLVVTGTGTLDKRGGPAAQTVTNCTLYSGATFYDPLQTITFTNGVDLPQCSPQDVTGDLGKNRTWTPTTI